MGSNENFFTVKKNIISNNIFGVDIESSAIEIARLRLWLSLIEDLDIESESGIDTLPNIEYNIEEGNSLIGFTEPSNFDWKSLNEEENKSTSTIFQEIDTLKNEFRKNSNPSEIKAMKNAIEKKLENYNFILNQRYITLLNIEHKIKLSIDNIHEMEAFHWRLKFSDIFSKNFGFDIIIGNPPYIEIPKLKYPVVLFESKTCNNTSALFIELSTKILKKDGLFGLIVPLSTICTDRMIPIQKILLNHCCNLWISSYDNRPGHLFSSGENIRYCIIVGKLKDNNERINVYSTKYNRWYSEQRKDLFKNLKYVECYECIKPGIIPKIGSKLEYDLLIKLRKQPPISKYLINFSSYPIHYHNSPRYWIRAMDFLPEFESNKGNVSSNLKVVYTSNEEWKKVIISILNSSLFYWFFIVSSDARHLNSREIENFSINLENMSINTKNILSHYCDELMKDYKKNSKIKETIYQKFGKVIYQEFYPKYSKPIIDKIDDELANYYGFTDEQKNFIVNFDRNFRIRGLFY